MDTPLGTGSRLRGAADVVFTTVEGGPALLSVATQEYRPLNETAVRIWQLLQVESSVEQMGGALAAEYDVTDIEARDAVLALCRQLLEAKLVEVVSD